MRGEPERFTFRRKRKAATPILPGLRQAVILLLLASPLLSPPAFALSALQGMPGSNGQSEEEPKDEAPSAPGLPLPDPLVGSSSAPATPVLPLNGGKPADAIYDESKLPEPVRRTRQLLVEAAASGDIERLRPLLGNGTSGAEISVGETAGDPVNTLKELAGDDAGIEILSAFLNILATGYVHVDVGTANEAYVWPYFAAKPLTALTPPEKVELLRIVTAGDYQDMLDFGTYSFFRIGIAPDGKLKFIRSGE
ncbi:hypothetical protein [Gellertiella hungarica]|uniref:Uncharacterized protein n=1 Tax=Gellertiella hungarica TaxID=1572859 RepID=A0A7W6NL65_9HYPH|nr:hypothetical protein [Gellertiella hungarica]MBB4065588.1 hypothetical protein [Gellertiella hungarica]